MKFFVVLLVLCCFNFNALEYPVYFPGLCTEGKKVVLKKGDFFLTFPPYEDLEGMRPLREGVSVGFQEAEPGFIHQEFDIYNIRHEKWNETETFVPEVYVPCYGEEEYYDLVVFFDKRDNESVGGYGGKIHEMTHVYSKSFSGYLRSFVQNEETFLFSPFVSKPETIVRSTKLEGQLWIEKTVFDFKRSGGGEDQGYDGVLLEVCYEEEVLSSFSNHHRRIFFWEYIGRENEEINEMVDRKVEVITQIEKQVKANIEDESMNLDGLFSLRVNLEKKELVFSKREYMAPENAKNMGFTDVIFIAGPQVSSIGRPYSFLENFVETWKPLVEIVDLFEEYHYSNTLKEERMYDFTHNMVELLKNIHKTEGGGDKKLAFVVCGDVTQTGLPEDHKLFRWVIYKAGIPSNHFILIPGMHDEYTYYGERGVKDGGKKINRFYSQARGLVGVYQSHPFENHMDVYDLSDRVSIITLDTNDWNGYSLLDEFNNFVSGGGIRGKIQRGTGQKLEEVLNRLKKEGKKAVLSFHSDIVDIENFNKFLSQIQDVVIGIVLGKKGHQEINEIDHFGIRTWKLGSVFEEEYAINDFVRLEIRNESLEILVIPNIGGDENGLVHGIFFLVVSFFLMQKSDMLFGKRGFKRLRVQLQILSLLILCVAALYTIKVNEDVESLMKSFVEYYGIPFNLYRTGVTYIIWSTLGVYLLYNGTILEVLVLSIYIISILTLYDRDIEKTVLLLLLLSVQNCLWFGTANIIVLLLFLCQSVGEGFANLYSVRYYFNNLEQYLEKAKSVKAFKFLDEFLFPLFSILSVYGFIFILYILFVVHNPFFLFMISTVIFWSMCSILRSSEDKSLFDRWIKKDHNHLVTFVIFIISVCGGLFLICSDCGAFVRNRLYQTVYSELKYKMKRLVLVLRKSTKNTWVREKAAIEFWEYQEKNDMERLNLTNNLKDLELKELVQASFNFFLILLFFKRQWARHALWRCDIRPQTLIDKYLDEITLKLKDLEEEDLNSPESLSFFEWFQQQFFFDFEKNRGRIEGLMISKVTKFFTLVEAIVMSSNVFDMKYLELNRYLEVDDYPILTYKVGKKMNEHFEVFKSNVFVGMAEVFENMAYRDRVGPYYFKFGIIYFVIMILVLFLSRLFLPNSFWVTLNEIIFRLLDEPITTTLMWKDFQVMVLIPLFVVSISFYVIWKVKIKGFIEKERNIYQDKVKKREKKFRDRVPKQFNHLYSQYGINWKEFIKMVGYSQCGINWKEFIKMVSFNRKKCQIERLGGNDEEVVVIGEEEKEKRNITSEEEEEESEGEDDEGKLLFERKLSKRDESGEGSTGLFLNDEEEKSVNIDFDLLESMDWECQKCESKEPFIWRKEYLNHNCSKINIIDPIKPFSYIIVHKIPYKHLEVVHLIKGSTKEYCNNVMEVANIRRGLKCDECGRKFRLRGFFNGERIIVLK